MPIKEFGIWIWEMIQKVFSFFMQPLGGIMMVLVTVVAAAYYGDQKGQSGYNQGMRNQKAADSINLNQQSSVISELKTEKASLQLQIATIKNVDCAEESRKAMAYIMSMSSELEAFNKSRMQRFQTVTQENKEVKNEISNLEKLIPKYQKQ